ncbi:protein FAM3A isoform X1 [Latimeria chalumnae]|uniref:protein FAM3A isoform X1 n=1 Tax=Latimeria chalumnae TaxID=7897 RepID=UPI0003C1608B|nr:PREDICTED: protein FAM3D [Latimeria chalumnae]|eukprot:XP_005997800.1 PREDICTED: protein FAM3D [Latimeria chalumnae]
MRLSGVLRVLFLILTLIVTWLLLSKFFNVNWRNLHLKQLEKLKQQQPETSKNKCGLEKSCPPYHFAFKIRSGAANVVGPQICFEGVNVMSSVKNNIGRGLNIALINGTSGVLLTTDFFDMYSGNVDDLLKFMKRVSRGTLVFVASYDDVSTKLTKEAKAIFTEIGSSLVESLHFRDNWVFAGAKGIQEKSPFEQHVRNDKNTNKYDGWPEVLELGGCIPKKMD